MRVPRYSVGLALVLAFVGMASAVVASVQAPKLGKPRPAPNTPSQMDPLPPAHYDPSLAIEGEDVKARKVETRLNVEVLVNGNGPYRFVVDSGADTSVVGLRIARGLQLPISTPVTLNAMTARNIVDRVKVDSLTVGSSTFRDMHLPALREGDLGGDGMLGIDALVQQRLMMDFERKLIKVEDGRIPYRPRPGEIVVTAKRKRGQLILTHVMAAGLPLDAIIDTGSQITIGNLALRDRLIRNNRNKFVTIAVTGVTGKTADLQLARIGELKLGPVTLTNVPMAFADVPPFEIFGISREPALLLGTDILENFRRVSLDFHNRKVRFQLRRCSEGIMLSTTTTVMTRISSTSDGGACER